MPTTEQVIAAAQAAAPTMQGLREMDARIPAAPQESDRVKNLRKMLAEMDAKLNDRSFQATPEVNPSARIALKTQLDDAIAEDAAKAKEPQTPASPDNSFARHYQAMGDAYGKANPPPVAKPAATGTGTKAAAVVEKLKAEDKKGGANFWDVIEAASAGWGGRKSAYADARQREKESKTEMDRLIKVTELQSAAQAAADARQYSSQLKLLEQADKLKKAGELGVSGIPGLSPTGQSLQTTLYGSK